MSKKYKNIKSLSHAKRIIAEQDRMIGELTRTNDNLEDTERRRQDWLRQAKKDAGYDRMTSFDDVWKETLEKAKKNV